MSTARAVRYRRLALAKEGNGCTGRRGRWSLFWLLGPALVVLISAGVVSIVVLLCLLPTLRAEAHDHNRPELNSWFDSLHSGNGPCCSVSDGVTVEDVDWESKDGHYRVFIDGQWLDVPPETVITVPNLAGRTMVWPIKSALYGILIRCFMPGPMT